MSNKLNLSAVEQYSKAYAAKICDEFFATNNTITGKQILSLTAIQQVNMLTIKSLFDKWQADTQKLRSPYFDFEANEVQQALKNFMNTVSQHIKVKRENFEPLLTDAVAETMVLIIEPKTFFKELMRDLPNFKFSEENIKPTAKYILINKDILPKLITKLDGQGFVFANQAMNWIEEMPIITENAEQYLAQFSEKLPLPEELLPISPTAESNESKSFFDFEPELIEKSSIKPVEVVSNRVITPSIDIFTPTSIVEKIDTLPEKVVETIEELPAKVETVVENSKEIVNDFTEPAKTIIENRVETIDTVTTAEVIAEKISPMSYFEQKLEPITSKINESFNDKASLKETDDMRLNERLASEQKSLNDQVNSGKTILDMHQNARIEGITAAISLNQRFLFTNNLFGGNIQAFSHALEELELCKDFGEAKELILKKYVPRYMWDITGAEAEEFIDIIKRRFN